MPDSELPGILYGKCGYTADGFVFLITDAVASDRQKIQAVFTWTPAIAEKMARAIADAAVEAAKIYNTSKENLPALPARQSPEADGLSPEADGPPARTQAGQAGMK